MMVIRGRQKIKSSTMIVRGEDYCLGLGINMDITRYYSRSNVDNADELYNTSGRPAWMNYVFVQIEGNNNRAMAEWNNPPCGDVMQTIQ